MKYEAVSKCNSNLEGFFFYAHRKLIEKCTCSFERVENVCNHDVVHSNKISVILRLWGCQGAENKILKNGLATL